MGLLREMVERLRNKEIEEDPEEIAKREKAGKEDADKIAKKLGQDRTNFVPKVDVSTLPIEMPEELDRDQTSREER